MGTKKRITIAVLYSLFLILLAEFGLGWPSYWLTQGRSYSYTREYEELKQERRNIIQANASSERVAAQIDQKQTATGRKYSTEILHPYLGFVVDFHDEDCPQIGFCDDRMRSYKELLHNRDFPEPAPDRAVVVITGGSVAYGVANNSSKGKLEQALATIPALRGKEILVYTLALGGYKQPQQLFALQYYLTMGAHFDMIINIDGFNDIVLPQAENMPFSTNPFFPRVWHTRVKWGIENRKGKMLEGLKFYLNDQRAKAAARMNKNLFRRSALLNLLWKFKDSSLQQKIAAADMDYLNHAKQGVRMSSTMITAGTKFSRENRERALEQIAAFWRRASEAMYALAKDDKIQYYHFLQPNQYVENSKPMSAAERKIAFFEGRNMVHPYAEPARQGYPHLIAQGRLLQKKGVPYFDLTMMFKDNSEVLYFDGCCHFNVKGYDYIIDEIVRRIKEDTSRQQN